MRTKSRLIILFRILAFLLNASNVRFFILTFFRCMIFRFHCEFLVQKSTENLSHTLIQKLFMILQKSFTTFCSKEFLHFNWLKCIFIGRNAKVRFNTFSPFAFLSNRNGCLYSYIMGRLTPFAKQFSCKITIFLILWRNSRKHC